MTLCSDLPGLDPTVTQKIYFEMKMYAGYQHVYTVVYDEDGEYVDTVYPAQGLRETTWIETSCAGGRLRGVAETVQQPTLTVDIEVEGNLVPPAVAGHYTFPQPEGCAGARKNYTYAIDNPDPEPDTPTELIAVSLNRNDGFVLKSWTGNCAHFDANGNYLGMLPESLPDDPDDWVTGDTIYVKCLKAQPTQMASAMTDMAALAGASMEGAIPPVAFTAVSAQVQAQVGYGPAVEITFVHCPNEGSFTTRNSENTAVCIAQIIPPLFHEHLSPFIEWEIQDDPAQTGDSGDPQDPQKGDHVTLQITAPAAASGRNFKLNYRIQASVLGLHESGWESIIQDDKDQLRQQYIDMSKNTIPERDSAALVNAASYQNLGNLAFGDCQCNGGAYCGSHSYLLDNSVSDSYQNVRNTLGGAITVTCAYRCPRYNASVGGTSESKHIYGHAFDFDNGEAVENWAVAKAAETAGISAQNIRLYRSAGEHKTLRWLIDNEYSDTNLPPGWETYRFGHITTE